MLKLMLDADRLRSSDALIARICERAAAGVRGQILIVPEQYSHAAERALCAAGGDTISRYAEVLSFTRLASRMFSLYGGVCEEYLDKGGRLLSVYLAAEQVRPRLKYYAAVSTKTEFLQRLGAAMEEFLSYCLPPEALREAAQRVSGQFAQKLEELSILYESYLSVCKTGRSDPVTRLQRLQALLRETDYASEHIFYLDGFSDFTAVERQIVSELLRRAPETVLTLSAVERGGAAFRSAGETLRWVKKEAARWNIPVCAEHPETTVQRDAALSQWLDGLFSLRAEPAQAQEAPLRLHHAASPEKECEFAQWRVRALLEAGCRCRDIGIALSDRAAYEPALRAGFARMQLPAYFAGSDDILSRPFFAAVLAAMEAVERYDYVPVLRFLKSGFGSLEADACDRLEKYAFVWSIHGMAWEAPWTMHPSGYGTAWDDDSRAELETLEAARAEAVAPLAALRRRWQAAKNAGEMVRALDEFLDGLGFAQRLERQAQVLERGGEPQRAQQTRQLYDILVDAMEQMYQVLGRCVMEPGRFADVFRTLLSQYQVGTIPATVDQIQIGAVDSFRNLRVKHLIALGAEEGKLPSYAPSLGVFTDDERQKLLTMGLSLAPAQEQKLERELGWIHAALSAAQDSCALCYSGDEPSSLYTRTQRLFPALRETRDDEIVYAADARGAAARLVQGGSTAVPQQPELKREIERLRAHGAYDFTSVCPETVRALYGAQVSLSASRIDRFAACRYAFFLYDGLKAREWKQARFDAPVFGTFVHYVLEKTVRAVMERGGFAVVEEAAVLRLAQEHAQVYTQTYLPDLPRRGERFAYLYGRNLREVLAVVQDVARELQISRFQPRDCELSFARGGELPPVEVRAPHGGGMVSGFVDRVDLYETENAAYYRVIDYKTGTKDFDYAELLLGKGLQMLIYLFALKEHGEARYGRRLLPAGVLYVPAREDMERIDPGMSAEELAKLRLKHKRRKGLLLDDEAVLQAMEPSEQSPVYLPYKLKKGERSGDLATREQMKQLEQFVERTLSEMTDAILTGSVEPNPIVRGPKHSACSYCAFAQACHKDACAHHDRYIAAVKAEQFWQELESKLEGRSDHG